MKTRNIKVSLAILNFKGTVASIENDDDVGFEICRISGQQDAKKACEAAAKKLREAANRFEKLALELEPFKNTTQNKINNPCPCN